MQGKLRSIAFSSFAWATILLAAPVAGQLAPPSTGGVDELDVLLQQLAEPQRVLMIGAHPDDEDTGLLSLMARGYGAEVAYLSLSRGEGGQNLIGTELGAALGLLRSAELVSARSVDGAKQFFTRAYDFGFTRSLGETNSYWPPDSILKDVVRVIRRFRPHVAISVFTGTPRDGHGQHQAAGVAAGRAFEVSADPDVFPELATEEGLEPWEPLRLYRSTRFDTASATVILPTGGLDQRVGRSFFQIAMESRSRHRSQDMGMLQPIGPRRASVRLLQDRTGHDDGLFAGIDVATPVSRLADSLRSVLHPVDPSSIAPGLVAAMHEAPNQYERKLLDRALAVAGGLVIDAIVADAEVVAGQTVPVQVSLYNAGPFVLSGVSLGVNAPPGWTVVPSDGSNDGDVGPGEMVTDTVSLTVAGDAGPTQPYFLAAPRRGYMYDWDGVDPKDRGLPFQPPAVTAVARADLMGARISIDREVTYRTSEQAVGEVREPLLVRPRVAVDVTPDELVWPSGMGGHRSFTVTATYYGQQPYRGQIEVSADGWGVSPPQRFSFHGPAEERTFTFEVTPPAGVTEASIELRAFANGDDGDVFGQTIKEVVYPHIRPVTWVEPASARIVLAPIALPPVSRVGYIRGAADRVPEALERVGLPVEMIDSEDLAKGDLTRFDVIVVGSRAYETDSALTAHNDRLLDYVRGGGHVVVQYQQYAFVNGSYAPYPLTIARPHDRVTDENAPVRILVPDHSVFSQPNTITDRDWDNWPQERGLYFPHTWDERYQPLLEMHDPGREPLRGALLVASVGSGTYVYTGLSFFRSLPAGVPGAYKLFFNILGIRSENVP